MMLVTIMPKVPSEKQQARMRASLRGRALHRSDETRAKISAALAGRILSDEHRERIRAALSGRTVSAETLARMRASNRSSDQDVRDKMSIAARKRPPMSDITKAKIRAANQGDKNPSWRGGNSIDGGGYARTLVNGCIYLLNHRLVMEKHLGRKLQTGEVVHHVNHDRKDNRIENLALCSNRKAHGWCNTEVSKAFFG
jgi:hypothetical protein